MVSEVTLVQTLSWTFLHIIHCLHAQY